MTEPPEYINSRNKPHYCGGWGPFVASAIGHVQGRPIYDILSEVAVEGPRQLFPLSNWADNPPVDPGYGAICKTCNGRAKKWKKGVSANFETARGFKGFCEILAELKGRSGP